MPCDRAPCLALRIRHRGGRCHDLPPESVSAVTFRYDFRPGSPDLSSFPSARWLKAVQASVKAMTPDDFGYGQRYGVLPLRQALADYLGRVRGVTADPRQILITGGFEQARNVHGADC